MLNLKDNDIELIKTILAPYSDEKHVKQMKQFVQHGKVSTWQHALNVTYLSYVVAKRLSKAGLIIDIDSLLIGAFLHDFYLYDWHTGRVRKEGVHGFSHPLVAKKNADKYFNLDNKTLNIIESHMFPMTMWCVPSSTEAVVVCLADKYCAIRENMQYRKGWYCYGKSI